MQNRTGYPSIDRPWKEFYTKEKLESPAPQEKIFNAIYETNIRFPNDVALSYYGKSISYGQLFENIDLVANALWAQGVRKGDIVTMMLLKQPEAVYLAYALNKIGAIINFISVLSGEEEIVHYLNEAKSDVLVVLDLFNSKVESIIHQTKVDKVISVSLCESMPFFTKMIAGKKLKAEYPQEFIKWKDFLRLGKGAFAEESEYVSGETAFLGHTGGTTGLPKGIELSDDVINGIADEYRMNLTSQRGDTYLDTIVPFHVYGFVVNTHMPLMLGMKTVILPKVEVADMSRVYMKYKPTHVISIPTYVEPVIEMTGKNLKFFKTVGAGGEGMTPEVEEKINAALESGGSDARCLNGYGMSEVGSTACTCQPHARKRGSVGIPLSRNVFAAFDPDTGAEKKYCEEGEICIQSPYLMNGYYKNQAATNEIVKQHADGHLWVHTGDIGYVDEEGFVFIKGRIKRIILTYDNGIATKIFPDNVENVLKKDEAVAAACVVPMDINEMPVKLTAFIEKNSNAKDSDDEIILRLKALCTRELQAFAVPTKYIFIDKMPVTAVGKVDYKALEKR